MTKMMSTEQFIERARKVHGDYYDYSKTIYQGMDKNIIVICPKHGEFTVSARNHLKGKKCKRCIYPCLSQEDFIKRGNEIHGGKDTYEKTHYVDSHTKVIVTCKIHGDYQVRLDHYMQGHRCE